jgi:hypothetical protein
MAWMLEALEPMMRSLYGDKVARIMMLTQRWIAEASGESAFVGDLTGGRMEMGGRIRVAEPTKVRALWTEMLTAMKTAKGGGIVVTTGSSTYRGMKILTMVAKLAPDATPFQRTALEPWGGTLTYAFASEKDGVLFGMGNGALARVKALIDGARGGGAVTSARLTASLADARAHRESMVVVMDLATVTLGVMAAKAGVAAPPPPTAGDTPVVLGIGNDAGALALRIAVPASQVRRVVEAARSSMMAGPAPTMAADEAIDLMGVLADKLCACKDRECGERVMQEMSNMKEPSGRPTREQLDRAMAIAERMSACQQKLMGP